MHPSPSYAVYISKLIYFDRVSSNVSDVNNWDQISTAILNKSENATPELFVIYIKKVCKPKMQWKV